MMLSGGGFFSRIMVGKLINGDDIPIVREHHDLEQRLCDGFHDVHKAPS